MLQFILYLLSLPLQWASKQIRYTLTHTLFVVPSPRRGGSRTVVISESSSVSSSPQPRIVLSPSSPCIGVEAALGGVFSMGWAGHFHNHPRSSEWLVLIISIGRAGRGRQVESPNSLSPKTLQEYRTTTPRLWLSIQAEEM